MDGRWKRVFAVGILFGLCGCETVNRAKPMGSSEPPLASKSSAPDDKSPPQLKTLVVWANLHLDSAMMPNHSERDREQNLKLALNTFQQVMQRDPKYLDGMIGMARTYRLMGDKDACVTWYQKATKAAPANAAIWSELGQSLELLHDGPAALHCYHMATTIDPDSKEYKKILGFALAHAGRYDEAFEWLSRCMTPANAHISVARMMDHNGQHELANQHFTAALKIEPGNQLARMALTNEAEPNAELIPANYQQLMTQSPSTSAMAAVPPQQLAIPNVAPTTNITPLVPQEGDWPPYVPNSGIVPSGATVISGWAQ